MSLASDIAAFQSRIDTRITQKFALKSIKKADVADSFDELADLLEEYSLDTAFTILVAPVITVLWTLLKADSSAYTPNTSTSKNITVDIGVIASFNATFQYPVPGLGQSGPVVISGDFGSTDPGAGIASAPLAKINITVNETDIVTFSKPKTGLIIVGGQVVAATGNDIATDNISINFSYKLYFGSTAKDGTSQPITDADILGFGSSFAASKAKTLTNFGGGGLKVCIGLPTSFGTPSFVVDGFTNTAQTKVRSGNFVNAAGATIQLDVWLFNFGNNSPIGTLQIV